MRIDLLASPCTDEELCICLDWISYRGFFFYFDCIKFIKKDARQFLEDIMKI